MEKLAAKWRQLWYLSPLDGTVVAKGGCPGVSPNFWRNLVFRVPNSLKIQPLRQKEAPPRGCRNLHWRKPPAAEQPKFA